MEKSTFKAHIDFHGSVLLSSRDNFAVHFMPNMNKIEAVNTIFFSFTQFRMIEWEELLAAIL